MERISFLSVRYKSRLPELAAFPPEAEGQHPSDRAEARQVSPLSQSAGTLRPDWWTPHPGVFGN